MVMHQAGWHITDDLAVPPNVTLVLLPPYSPELNPVERVWLYLRERYLSHRRLNSYDAIAEALSITWNKLSIARLTSLTAIPIPNPGQVLSRSVSVGSSLAEYTSISPRLRLRRSIGVVLLVNAMQGEDMLGRVDRDALKLHLDGPPFG
jgi:hypothetical protein